jgi:hypothetical protein
LPQITTLAHSAPPYVCRKWRGGLRHTLRCLQRERLACTRALARPTWRVDGKCCPLRGARKQSVLCEHLTKSRCLRSPEWFLDLIWHCAGLFYHTGKIHLLKLQTSNWKIVPQTLVLMHIRERFWENIIAPMEFPRNMLCSGWSIRAKWQTLWINL